MTDPPQVFLLQEAYFLAIEQFEDAVDVSPAIIVKQFGGEQMNELFKSDPPCSLCIAIQDELVNGFIFSRLPKGSESLLQFFGIDDSRIISVEYIESFFDIEDVTFSEARALVRFGIELELFCSFTLLGFVHKSLDIQQSIIFNGLNSFWGEQ